MSSRVVGEKMPTWERPWGASLRQRGQPKGEEKATLSTARLKHLLMEQGGSDELRRLQVVRQHLEPAGGQEGS